MTALRAVSHGGTWTFIRQFYFLAASCIRRQLCRLDLSLLTSVYLLAERNNFCVPFFYSHLCLPAHARNSRLAYAILLGPGRYRNPSSVIHVKRFFFVRCYCKRWTTTATLLGLITQHPVFKSISYKNNRRARCYTFKSTKTLDVKNYKNSWQAPFLPSWKQETTEPDRVTFEITTMKYIICCSWVQRSCFRHRSGPQVWWEIINSFTNSEWDN